MAIGNARDTFEDASARRVFRTLSALRLLGDLGAGCG